MKNFIHSLVYFIPLFLLFLLYAFLSYNTPSIPVNEYNRIYVKEYDIVSVSQYIKYETNAFGGITKSYPAYTFTYIDKGSLKTVNEFVHHEYGLSKLCIGEENKYVVDSYGGGTYYLYLTKETLSNIKM